MGKLNARLKSVVLLKMQTVKVIRGGLAGSEVAYYLAKKGVEVELYDINPNKMTPAHKRTYYACKFGVSIYLGFDV